jgi:hypothetical protein
MEGKLIGKLAPVTGGIKDIGLATAKALARECAGSRSGVNKTDVAGFVPKWCRGTPAYAPAVARYANRCSTLNLGLARVEGEQQ